jgi:hypothetical protein
VKLAMAPLWTTSLTEMFLMLENDILKKIEEKYGNPLFGSSPDCINSDYVFEIECPFKTSTDIYYINAGRT